MAKKQQTLPPGGVMGVDAGTSSPVIDKLDKIAQANKLEADKAKVRWRLIVSGNYMEYRDYCNHHKMPVDQPGGKGGTWLYLSSVDQVLGLKDCDVQFIGTWKKRKDAKEVFDKIMGFSAVGKFKILPEPDGKPALSPEVKPKAICEYCGRKLGVIQDGGWDVALCGTKDCPVYSKRRGLADKFDWT